MNILTDCLPTAVMIDGREYEIETDFRVSLRVILAFEDPELADIEKAEVLVQALYKVRPDNMSAAVKQGMKFLNGGEESEEEENPLRLYSFEHDAGFIFAAFKQTHGIDLDTADLHWWKFLTLFMDLGPDTTFCNLVSLRKRVKTGQATKEEKKAAHEMRDIFEIPEPDTRTAEEKEREAEFLRMVNGGIQ